MGCQNKCQAFTKNSVERLGGGNFWRRDICNKKPDYNRLSMAATAETSPVIKILVVGDAGVGKTSIIQR